MENEKAKKFGVKCYRHASSIFGEATRWAKKADGNRIEFDTVEEAERYAEKRNNKGILNCEYFFSRI